METIQELSKGIISSLSGHLKNDSPVLQESNITSKISWWLDDVFKLINNIDQTSLNSIDRAERLIELEKKFGIPKTHLILKNLK
jgi:hypothetical protein